MQLTRALHKALIEAPGRIALEDAGCRRNWAEVAQRVARLAGLLRTLGVGAGDRVAVLGMNSARYCEALLAVWWAGGVVNPVNIRWSVSEMAFSLQDCDSRWLLLDAAFAARAQDLRAAAPALAHLVYWGDGAAPAGLLDGEAEAARGAPVDDACRRGDDLAAVLYTGGTTGTPKGVMLSHANLGIGTLAASTALLRDADCSALICAPLFHVGAIGQWLQVLGRLGRVVLLPGFDELAVLGALAQSRASEVFLVPTMLKRLLEHPRRGEFDLSALRWVLYGAAPIDAALLELALRALPGVGFVQFYGMTELSPVVTALPASCHRLDAGALLQSAGRPIPIAEVKVVDAAGQDLAPGEVGEIVARGPMVMQGYWGLPELSAEAMRNGWMHTGDLGRFDAEGFLHVVDRLKDMIITGGENVYSAEVENALLAHPQVAACAVVAVPDALWGERVHAVVVARPGSAPGAEQLIAHCRTRLAGYKCPRTLEFRDALPMSAAGKLLKFQLRAQLRKSAG
jgi:acyl-CoA synthetase (AMP-forming)/AMP-acid ligase II